MTNTEETLKKIADLLRQTADEIGKLYSTEEDKHIVQDEVQTPSEPAPEEHMLVTAAEAGDPIEPQKRTIEETRAIVSKALMAKLRSETKEILSKYGSSVSEVGEKTPEKLGLLYDEVEALLEKNNA